ncbi:MAG: hypothetical protein FIA99_12505 [Ruminiclostridium sp.]|nr:hypothetical protein [Ruminiclostridium sp.]
MFIELLKINGFGKITGLSIKLEKGLNIIFGGNESGKTTLQWFIRGMLFGLKGGRASRDGLPAPLKRYLPWSGNDYGGSMQYTLDNGSSFRVDRDFLRNSAAVYDATYNNITANFDSGRDRGLMFADRHLGLNDICFEKTVLIRQMETRLDDDGSGELISRLVNINQTGQEDLSFKKASEALKEALKKHIGTDRTTTQPVDRIAARLAELKAARKKPAEKRSCMISAGSELQELVISESRLKKRKVYLETVKESIDAKKQLEEESVRHSKLCEAAGKLEETDRELFTANEELKKFQKINNSPDAGEKSGASPKQGADGKIPPVALLLFGAAGAAAILGLLFHPAWLVASAILICAAVLFIKNQDNNKKALLQLQKTDAHSNLQLYEQRMQKVIALNGRIKDICSEASMALGKQMEGMEGLTAAISEKSAVLVLLEQKLRNGLNAACSSGADCESGFFAASTLKDVIYRSSPNWLKDSWDYEVERVNDGLVQTALKIKECETMLRGFQEEGEELQSIDEEIADLEQRKLELEKTGASLRMALDVLTEASREIRCSFAPLLNSEMSRIIAGITGGRYIELKADDSLSLNAVSPESGHVRGAMALSGGTADQMYLALRLALSDLLSKDKESLPLLLDEVFSQYDDKRIHKTLEYLFNEHMGRQVILFTCKEREVETAVSVTGGRLNVVRLDENGRW